MTFEQTLRDRLGHEADALDLPLRHPDRAIARARARSRHRRAAAAAGTAVVVTAAAAVAVPIVRKDGGAGHKDAEVAPVADQTPAVLPTGPLNLSWTNGQGGVMGLDHAFEGDDGVVYALSTAPGVRYQDADEHGSYPKALYRLGDDGTWQATNLDGNRPDAIDASSAGGLLYAVSTAPGDSDTQTPRISTSGDGGESWTSEDIPPADPPSDQDVWDQSVWMSIESTGSKTLAKVTTGYSVDPEAVFPEYADGGYSVEERPEGVALVRYDVAADLTVLEAQAEADAQAQGQAAAASDGYDEYVVLSQAQPAPTTVPADEPSPTTTQAPAPPGRFGGTVVRTVPWSDLGVSGQEAVASRHQFFLRTEDGWQRVAQDMGDVGPVKLGVVGDRFYLAGDISEVGSRDGAGLVYTSADGESWTSAEIPPNSYVNGMGDALVAASYEGGIKLSRDYGASWEQVDTSATGMTPDVQVMQITGGPLGLALLAQNGNGAPMQLITTADLVTWTVTPVSDISGIADVAYGTVFVGTDRIVVTAFGHGGPGNVPPAPHATVVGVPARG